MSALLIGRALRVDMPAVPKLVVIVLADCCNEQGECWPTKVYLARMAGCDYGEVSRALDLLFAIGLLTRIGAPAPGQPTRYRLDEDLLGRLATLGLWQRLLEDRGAP